MTEDQRKIIGVLIDAGTIRGFELKRLSGLESTALVDAIKPLIDDNLIMASGIVRPETIDRVHFAPFSSTKEKLAYLLRST